MEERTEDYRSAIDALERNEFSDAFRMLDELKSSTQLSGEGLERLAEAAFWSGHPDESLQAKEAAYNKYIEEGLPLRAGYVALMLGRDYGDRNEPVRFGSWFSRAEKLLEEDPDSIEFGYLEMLRGFMAHYSGEEDAALAHGQRASAIASSHGDRDLQGMSLMPQALALIHKGDKDEGLKLMDEATMAAVNGELSAEPTGAIYCMTIGVCRELADYRRAAEWTEAAERWCKRTSIAGFPGICRVRRAEIMSLRGSWLEAEQEAVKAADELEKYGSAETIAESFKEIGLIRLRMGDLEGAESALEHAHEIYKAPQPGLALLRLAQGKPEVAMASIKAALAEETWNRLARARLLPALVEIAVALRDAESARSGSEELEAIATDYGSAALRAASATATAQVHMMNGDPIRAIKLAQESRALWQEVGAPYEAAKARVILGQAILVNGDIDQGKMELRAAMSNLEKLGALQDARGVSALLDEGKDSSRPRTSSKSFMFTDIVGSTDLVHLIGDDAWSNLLRWHDQTLKGVIEESKGQVVKQVGDGFFVAFDDPSTAIECAVAIQRRLVAHRAEHGFAPQVRIGVHAAAALDLDGDYGGRGVHEAARIGAIAKGGEVVVSASTIEGLSIATKDPRKVELKGIAEPVEVRTVVWR